MSLNNRVLDFLSRSVPFLQNWPTNELKGNTDCCSIYYFDRNQVLVRDSNNSDWIYIVLKGSLSVIKKLKAVDPQTDLALPPKRAKVTFSRTCSNRHLHKSDHKTKGANRSQIVHVRKERSREATESSVVSDTRINNITTSQGNLWKARGLKFSENHSKCFKNAMELEHTLEQTLPGFHNNVDRLGSLDYDRIIHEHRSRLVQRSPTMATKRLSSNNNIDLGQSDRLKHDDGITVYNNDNESRSADHGENLVKHERGCLPDIRSQEKQRSNESKSHRIKRTSHFLPEISINNKVGGRENQPDMEREMGMQSRRDNEDEGNEADNEDRFSPSSVESIKKTSMRKARRIRKTLKGVYLVPSRKEKKDAGEEVRRQENIPDEHPGKNKPGNVVTILSSDSNHPARDGTGDEIISEKLAKLQIKYQRRITDGEGRKTIAEELDYKARRDFKFTECDLDPTIIEIQVLERGQYFGISSILFPDQPSLSVISNGAECVVMSKKFFLQLATDKCITTLRQTETPYPSDQQLGIKLQEAVNWQASRSAIFTRLQNEVLQRQAKRRQFLPSHQGQYCFRTGPT